MKTALLLIDLQNDHLARAELRPRSACLVRRAALLAEGCRRLGVPVIHGRTTIHRDGERRMPHWEAEDRWECVEGTAGYEAPVPLRPRPGELVVEKRGFSVFESGDLDRALADLNCDTLIMAGLHLHACVRAAVLDAYARGYRVVIAEDAVASDDALHAAVTRRYLEQRAVAFRPVDHILQALAAGVQNAADELAGGAAFVHRSPRDVRQVLFTLRDTGLDRLREATAAARRAFSAWRATETAARRTLLRNVARALQRESESLARLLVERPEPDEGKDRPVTGLLGSLRIVERVQARLEKEEGHEADDGDCRERDAERLHPRDRPSAEQERKREKDSPADDREHEGEVEEAFEEKLRRVARGGEELAQQRRPERAVHSNQDRLAARQERGEDCRGEQQPDQDKAAEGEAVPFELGPDHRPVRPGRRRPFGPVSRM